MRGVVVDDCWFGSTVRVALREVALPDELYDYFDLFHGNKFRNSLSYAPFLVNFFFGFPLSAFSSTHETHGYVSYRH